MQVEKPPLVILYFFGAIFSIFSPKKITTVSCPTTGGGAMAPARAGCGLGGLTVEKPVALKKVPRPVSVSNSARSAEIRLSPCASTTLPVAIALLVPVYIITSSA